MCLQYNVGHLVKPSFIEHLICVFPFLLLRPVRPPLLLLLFSWMFQQEHLNSNMTKPLSACQWKISCHKEDMWQRKAKKNLDSQVILKLLPACTQTFPDTDCGKDLVCVFADEHFTIQSPWTKPASMQTEAKSGGHCGMGHHLPFLHSHKYFSAPPSLRFRESKMKENRMNLEILKKNFPDRTF